MVKNSSKNRYVEELASKILQHKKLYYLGKSSISDIEYDALENELKKLAPNHPILSFVGYQFDEISNKVSHEVPMLSLAKTYSVDDLYDFIQKSFCVAMDKIDGMALSLEYDFSGKLFRASTRGNGKAGENVTEHICHITNIPKILNISSKDTNYKFEIRGEVYFPLSDFNGFSDRFDSFRNAVPGTLGRKEVEEALDVLRVLRFCVYDVLIFKNNNPLSAKEFFTYINKNNNYLDKIKYSQELGFTDNTNILEKIDQINNVNELQEYITTWYKKDRNYQIDGIVFRYGDEILWENFGNTAHHPRGSIAFKQAGETAETEILAIEENVGRSGKITFRAKLKTVELSGAKISYATLHNAEFIEEGNYAVGAKVEIIRSGEVIPAIIRLIEPASRAFNLPEFCKCGSKLTRQGPDLMCLDNPVCNFKDQESLVYFVSALDIMGVSDKIVLKIRDAGLVQEPADFYKLTEEDLLQIEGFAKKSSENVVKAIQNARKIPLAKFLTSLGLKRGGAVKCQEVARKFESLENVLKIDAEDLKVEKGWADKSAEDFIESLKNKRKIIINLLKYVEVLNDESNKKISNQNSHPFFGKNICITGSLSRPRDEYKFMLENVGAKLVSSVSSKTDLLVCNESSSSNKYKDAIKFGIKIITEEEFLRNFN
ncbi:NAD-dependent DNA ligase LigA [Pigmentibacter sp. JX0631]|uniref:NAD-dependent DNA ligase LigA n=1 Tax=Pigmentibacter sp. JX0631 TaxID=2976982 RepID=UPI0024687DA2|nr:NAD-dependent DNA ligase LigA [Pigmentibacter sp. JX0631]WGL58517.1 NAD-dependent DNA ligase LigA [Pigmentibacter sp. JX0631]